MDKLDGSNKKTANRFDGDRAIKSLDKLIGRKQEAESKKFVDIFDETELDAEIQKVKEQLNKLNYKD